MNLETLAPGPGPPSMMRNPNQITGIILEEFRRFGLLITNWTSIGKYFFLLIYLPIFFYFLNEIIYFLQYIKNNPYKYPRILENKRDFKKIFFFSTRDSELTGKRRSSIWLSNDPGSDSSGESPEPEKDTEPEPKPAKQDPEPPSTPSPAELKVEPDYQFSNFSHLIITKLVVTREVIQ